AEGSGCGVDPASADGSAWSPVSRSRWLPAKCTPVGPTCTSTLPAAVSSGVTHDSGSGTWATAVTTRVGGTAWRRPSRPVYVLLSESFPDTNGASYARAASQQPATAATRPPSVASSRGSPHEKLSS